MLYSRACLSCVCVSRSVVSDSLRPVDCSLPGFSAHGILQASTGVGCHSLLRGPRDWTWLSCTAGRFFTVFLGQTQFLGSCTWIVDVWVKRNFLFFFTRTILKVLIELATVLLIFYLFFFFFHGVWWLILCVTLTELTDDQRTGETVLLAVSLRLSPEDRSIWNDRLSKEDHPCHCEWAAPKCWLPAKSLEHLSSPALGY